MKLKLKDITGAKILKRDSRFMMQNPNGDPSFSPEHNLDVINRTIEHNDKLQKKLEKEYMGQVEERADAASYYLKALMRNKVSGPNKAEKYFGKKRLAQLRGFEIAEKLQQFKKAQEFADKLSN